MKVRTGFVSNSSSSSFIVQTPFEEKDVLPTHSDYHYTLKEQNEIQNLEAVDLWLESEIDSEELKELIEA